MAEVKAYVRNAGLAMVELSEVARLADAALGLASKCRSDQADQSAARLARAVDLLRDALLPLSRGIALADYARVQAEKEAGAENISEAVESK